MPPSVRGVRVRVHVALVAAGVLAMLGAGVAQGRGGAPANPAGRGSFADNFSGGKVTVVDSSEMRMSRIRFEAGARTNWHVHSTGQLLLVEEGEGRLQEQGAAVRVLTAGQPVYTKPNVVHWHGAAPDKAALQFSVYSGTLDWKDAVTDEQYRGRK